ERGVVVGDSFRARGPVGREPPAELRPEALVLGGVREVHVPDGFISLPRSRYHAGRMPSAPVVSILLPAFQAETTLDACLRSIVRQTEPRWECVLVDDGSTDRTADIARDW